MILLHLDQTQFKSYKTKHIDEIHVTIPHNPDKPEKKMKSMKNPMRRKKIHINKTVEVLNNIIN